MRAVDHIEALDPYTPGEQPTEAGWIKLNTNEMPFPPSPRVGPAIAAEIEALRLYPHPASQPLREALAARHEVASDQVIVGNGSDDVLNLLVRAYGTPGRTVAMAEPCYSLYPVLVQAAGNEIVRIPFDEDFALPTAAIIAAQPDLFFLTSPNAPTGVGFPRAELAALAEQLNGLLVIDEAYAAFAEEDAVPLVRRFPNVVVVRTFSKSHALAGLRVGYGLGAAEVINRLDRVRDVYNVDRLAQAGALAALSDADYYTGLVLKVISLRNYYAAVLKRWGWFTYPSESNFLFTAPAKEGGEPSPEAAADLFAWLKERRILVRAFPRHPLTARFLRLSIGTEEQMETLAEAMESWRANA